ncbi:MAG: hypothetical protein KC621_27645 [Myxococcales bacterium]|nr:hypothetical protein [Myxococcales bacterium]
MALAGLAHLNKGFCFDAAGDEAFALGWPHVRRLTDESVDAFRSALRHLSEPDFDLSIHWPRPLAAALVHAWGVGQLFHLAPGSREFSQAAEEAAFSTVAPTPDQVRQYLSERLSRSPMWASERATESFVLLMEALVGSEVVVDAILEHLEGLDGHELNDHLVQPAWITFQLGYLLLRVPAAAAKEYQARMRSLVSGAGAPRSVAPPSHVRSLLLALDGARAADRLTDKDPRYYTHAVGDATTVRMRASIHRGWAFPDPRLVFLGGTDVLSSRAFQSWAKLPARDQRVFFEAVAPIKHPGVVTIMAAMVSQGTGTKPQARRWLLQHWDFAKPVLSELAARSDEIRDLLATL